LSKYHYFYLKVKLYNYYWIILKHSSCESSDGRSKHRIYRAGNEVYGRI